jgi:hypothetical protein
MKKQLEIGDKIQRFEVMLSREIDYVYVIDSVTKTLAKSKNQTFKRDLDFNTIHPKKSKNKIIARVYTKEPSTWSSPDFFLINEELTINL